ncbi:MAG: MFS transporter [Deltaproteobacteria bacterium]|nr:MFS transporter [Deltaproteobacteria bacterium]
MIGIHSLRGLPKCVWLLFAADLVNSTGYFVLPFLTILLTDRMGMGSAEAGMYLAAANVAYGPGSMLGGKLADHFGRKRVYVGARVLAALTLMSCAMLGRSPLVPWIVIGSILASSATEPAVSAMVADVTPPGQRQAAFSLVYLGRNLGFAVGPILAGLMYRTHPAWLFVGDGLTSIAAAVLVMLWIPETLPAAGASSDVPEADAEQPEAGGVIAALWRRPWMLVFAVALSAYTLVYVQCVFGLPLQVNALFAGDGPARYGALMSVNAVAVIVLTAPLVRLTGRMATTRRLVLGGIAYMAGFGSIFLLRTMPLLVLSTVIWSVGEVLVATNSRVFIADNAPSSHRGRFNAAVNLLAGGGYVIGPLVGGVLIARMGMESLWKACLLIAMGASALMLLPAWMGRGRMVDGGDRALTHSGR